MLLLLLQLSCPVRTMVWRQVVQVSGCYGVGRAGRTVHLRGRASAQCWVVPGQIPHMGCWRVTLPHHPPQYVPACCQGRAEGSREVCPPRLLALPAKAKPRGRCTHHMTCGALNLSEGDLGPLPWSILTKKVAWPTALWVPVDGRGHPRHHVFPEELLAEMSGHCHARGGPIGGCHGHPMAHPATGIPIQVPGERLPTWWSPLRGQRVSPVGIGGHPHAGVNYWKTEPGSRECPTPMPPQLQQQPPLE